MADMSPTPVNAPAEKAEASPFNTIAKNFLLLPDIARELSLVRQGFIEYLKLKGITPSQEVEATFFKPSEAEKPTAPTAVTEEAAGVEKKKKPGLFKGMLDLLKPKNILKSFKMLFNPKTFMRALGRLALPVMIAMAVWEGISAGWEKWKETGSIFEAVKFGIGGLVEFVTFGLIDKQMVADFYQWEADAVVKIGESISGFFGKIGDWIGEKWSAIKQLFGIETKPKGAPASEEGEKEQSKETKGKDAQQQAADLLSKPVQLPGEPPPAKVEQPAGAKPSGAAAGAPSAVPTTAKGEKPSGADVKAKKIGSSTGKTSMIKAMDSAKIEDPTARAAIMAQVGHESGGFTTLSENLNYKAATLLKLFPKKFNSPDDAQQVASGGPKSVAERIYGGRMGNAPEGSGDGFNFRGRGFIQLTGKQNYTKFGVASDPDSVSEPGKAADTAIKYMLGYKGDWGDITGVTKFVNGGTIGLSDRAELFEGFKNDPEITKVASSQTTPSGGSVASASNDVASGQRQQQKPQTPIIVNAPTNNTKVTNTTQLAQKPKDNTSAGNTLVARAA